MTIGVLVHHDVSPERIRQIIPAGRTTCQVLYIDPAGRYVHGLVMCAAKDLRAVVDGAARDALTTIAAEDARNREQAARWGDTGDAYRACSGMD